MPTPLPAGRPADRFCCLGQLMCIDVPGHGALSALLLIIAVDGTNARVDGVVLLWGGYLA